MQSQTAQPILPYLSPSFSFTFSYSGRRVFFACRITTAECELRISVRQIFPEDNLRNSQTDQPFLKSLTLEFDRYSANYNSISV